MHAPSAADSHEIGEPLAGDLLVRSGPHREGNTLVEDLEAHGGAAYLVVDRGPCKPSVVPLAALPGFARREAAPRFDIAIPTCAASASDMVELRGAFIHGGVGEPPSPAALEASSVEQVMELPPFRIDRLEVSNARFAAFGAMSTFTGMSAAAIPRTPGLEGASEPSMPVVGVDWYVARAYCRFLGNDLPTSPQWSRALRGPLQLATGPNPQPRRNYPWGGEITAPRVRLAKMGTAGPASVGASADDRSVDGVLDLAGNVQEWTRTPSADSPGFRVARGGNFLDTILGDTDYTAIENERVITMQYFALGFRCASDD